MTVILDVLDGLARITIDRPQARNALDLETGKAWTAAVVQAVNTPEVRAILLTGEGNAFCAGADVEAVSSESSDYVYELATAVGQGILTLHDSLVPVIAAVNGPVAGGGFGIFLSSDIAIASSNARFGALYANIGLTPDLSITTQLVDAVGERRALELLLTPRMLSADEALTWGLVSRVVSPDELDSEVVGLAKSWICGAPAAHGRAKKLVREGRLRSLRDQMSEEARTVAQMVQTADATRLIDQFLSSRKNRGAK